MARPTKLAEKRVSAVLEVIAAGGSRATGANAAGITPSTLYEWLRRGKKEHNASALDPDHDYTVRELRGSARRFTYPDTPDCAGRIG